MDTPSTDAPISPLRQRMQHDMLMRGLCARIRSARPDMPVGAIAGIDLMRAGDVVRAGASGVAMISGIFRAADIAAATRAMRATVDTALKESSQ